jgi:hypothetical protein
MSANVIAKGDEHALRGAGGLPRRDGIRTSGAACDGSGRPIAAARHLRYRKAPTERRRNGGELD